MGTENKQVIARKQEVHNEDGHHTKTEVTASAYKGPLPPAEAFEKYEAVALGQLIGLFLWLKDKLPIGKLLKRR